MLNVTHAGAVVFRPDPDTTRYLVVEASGNPEHKVLPKGHIEPGESPAETALREVREEAGVGGERISHIDTVELTVGGETFGVEYYLVLYTGDVESAEERKTFWLPYDDALGVLTFEENRALLRSAHPLVLQYLKGHDTPC